MALGYRFAVRTTPPKQPSQSRKKSLTTKPSTASQSSKKSACTDVPSAEAAKPKPRAERRTSDPKKRRSSKGPGASPRSQRKKVEHLPNTISLPQQPQPVHQRRPSGASVNPPVHAPPMMAPYGNQYRPQQSQQMAQRPTPQQQQSQQLAQQHQQRTQHPSNQTKQQQYSQTKQQQFTSHQMAQLRMMQQQQGSPQRPPQVNTNFPPMQQFFAPSPLSHPNAPHGGNRGMPTLQQMRGRSPMHQQRGMGPAPGAPPNQAQQGNLPPNNNDASQNDPLFMLK